MRSRTSRGLPHEPKMWSYSRQTHLLLEDFNLQVVPYRNGEDAYELSVQGTSSSQINEALALSPWDSRRGADGFVRVVASALLTEHEAWLEVILKPDDRDGLPFRPLLVHGLRKRQMGA